MTISDISAKLRGETTRLSPRSPLHPAAKPGTHQWTALERREVATRYLAGESTAEIAESYGVGREFISGIIRREGVRTRVMDRPVGLKPAKTLTYEEAKRRLLERGQK